MEWTIKCGNKIIVLLRFGQTIVISRHNGLAVKGQAYSEIKTQKYLLCMRACVLVCVYDASFQAILNRSAIIKNTISTIIITSVHFIFSLNHHHVININ